MPALENMPATHAPQLVAPVDDWKLPAGHIVQTLDAKALYCPAAHAAHIVDATVALYFPASQFVHAVAPVLPEKVPTAHAWQDVEPEKYVPV